MIELALWAIGAVGTGFFAVLVWGAIALGLYNAWRVYEEGR